MASNYIIMKICSKCRTGKSIDEFYICYGKPESVCKVCKKMYITKYNKENKSKRRVWQRKHYDKNKIKINHASITWQKANKKNVAAIKKKYRISHPDIRKKAGKVHYYKVSKTDKYKAERRKLMSDISTKLTDGYVTRQLRKHGFELQNIKSNPELIEVYREILKIKRHVKGKEKSTKKHAGT